MGTPLKSGETVIGEIAVGLPLDVMVAPHGDNVFSVTDYRLVYEHCGGLCATIIWMRFCFKRKISLRRGEQRRVVCTCRGFT